MVEGMVYKYIDKAVVGVFGIFPFFGRGGFGTFFLSLSRGSDVCGQMILWDREGGRESRER